MIGRSTQRGQRRSHRSARRLSKQGEKRSEVATLDSPGRGRGHRNAHHGDRRHRRRGRLHREQRLVHGRGRHRVGGRHALRQAGRRAHADRHHFRGHQMRGHNGHLRRAPDLDHRQVHLDVQLHRRFRRRRPVGHRGGVSQLQPEQLPVHRPIAEPAERVLRAGQHGPGRLGRPLPHAECRRLEQRRRHHQLVGHGHRLRHRLGWWPHPGHRLRDREHVRHHQDL